jgi:hypothetical protein
MYFFKNEKEVKKKEGFYLEVEVSITYITFGQQTDRQQLKAKNTRDNNT